MTILQWATQNPICFTICFIIVIIAIVFFFWYFSENIIFKSNESVERMIKADECYEKTENGEKGRSRSRWDYSNFPGLSRISMKIEARFVLASVMISCLFILWLFTCKEENAFLIDLIQVNFGALIATLVGKD